MDAKLKKRFPVLSEMRHRYPRMRANGHGREESLTELFRWAETYSQSYEELILHRISLGEQLAEHRELYKDMAIVTGEAFDELIRLHPGMETALCAERERILREENYGEPAAYPEWEEFSAGWHSGDLFALPLKGRYPELFGLCGKTLLILAREARRGEGGYWEELVYLSICDGDALPGSPEELKALGFLPAYTVFREYQYLFALRFRTAEELQALKLIPLGNFTGEYHPLLERGKQGRAATVLVPGRAYRNEMPLVRTACCAWHHFGTIATAEQAKMAKKDWNYGAKCRTEAGEPAPAVKLEASPLGKLGSRTYFTYHSNLAEKIPHGTFPQPED